MTPRKIPTGDEFVAGPYHPFKKDRTFSDAYLADAKKHGYEGEELMEMARKTEASMPELANVEAGGDGGDGVRLPLQALREFISQPHDFLQLMPGGGMQPGGPEDDA